MLNKINFTNKLLKTLLISTHILSSRVIWCYWGQASLSPAALALGIPGNIKRGPWLLFTFLSTALSDAISLQKTSELEVTLVQRRERSVCLNIGCTPKPSLGNKGIRVTAPSPSARPPHRWPSAGSCRVGAGWDPQPGLFPRLGGSRGLTGLVRGLAPGSLRARALCGDNSTVLHRRLRGWGKQGSRREGCLYQGKRAPSGTRPCPASSPADGTTLAAIAHPAEPKRSAVSPPACVICRKPQWTWGLVGVRKSARCKSRCDGPSQKPPQGARASASSGSSRLPGVPSSSTTWAPDLVHVPALFPEDAFLSGGKGFYPASLPPPLFSVWLKKISSFLRKLQLPVTLQTRHQASRAATKASSARNSSHYQGF